MEELLTVSLQTQLSNYQITQYLIQEPKNRR